MDRVDLGNLSAFVTVAEQRSFRGAAGRLKLTPSALSHAMRQLEENLGVRLLNRTTRSVSLTNAGKRLLDQVQPAMNQIAGALDSLDQERLHPFGQLRIYATRQFAVTTVIAPVWRQFLSTYPDVHLEVHVGDAPIDIVAKGFDAGIGPRDEVAADMIAVRVMGPMKVAFVGAPSYLARRPPPHTPDDLAGHSCIQYRLAIDGPVFDWPIIKNGKARRISVDGPVTVSDAYLAARAAVDGLGIALTVEAVVEPFVRAGQLVRVLEDYSASFEGLFLYYPGRRQVPVSLRALIDTVRAARGPAPTGRSLQNPFTKD
jgi:DNA-binding transcriptional LysR family regulator